MKKVFLLLFLFTIFFCLLILRQRVVKLSSEIKKIEMEMKNYEEYVERLKLEIYSIGNIENLEKIARKRGILK